MTSVPLHCNICPKQPEFSDISHLLTHVASKGHLSQQFKAQVRARQDVTIRDKLDAYDRWFEAHHIERLLSERMMAKDSKDSGSRGSAADSNPPRPNNDKESKPRRRRIKPEHKEKQDLNPIKVEGTIDPQLSDAILPSKSRKTRPSSLSTEPYSQSENIPAISDPVRSTTPLNSRSPFFPTQRFPDHSHRTYVPLMSQWQSLSSPPNAGPVRTPSVTNHARTIHQTYDSDAENECFRTFLRSPTKAAYPDPSEIIGFQSGFPTSTTTPIKQQDEESILIGDTPLDTNRLPQVGAAPQSPILKGIKWPGMSLFDSASLEAQRLRNQKKDTSVLEQMECNSASVEQIERIYWPDGALKKERVITGNVDSSPVKEPTPPPKPQKRRRARVDTSVLADLSTNVPVLGRKPRTRRTVGKLSTKEEFNQVDHAGRVDSNQPYGSHVGGDRAAVEHLTGPTASQPRRNYSKRGFEVYRDTASKIHPSANPSRPLQSHAHEARHVGRPMRLLTSEFVPQDRGKTAHKTISSNATGEPLHDHDAQPTYRQNRPSSPGANQENIRPILDQQGRIEDVDHSESDRVTQRYFVMNSNAPPQFFSSMPPGWDFGGFHESRYLGSTLNPLNTYLRHHVSYPSQSQAPYRLDHNGLPHYDDSKSRKSPKA